MKNTLKQFGTRSLGLGVIALAALLAFGLAACDLEPVEEDPVLTGSITITVGDLVVDGLISSRTLTANWAPGTGEPTNVDYQWKKDGSGIGNAKTFNAIAEGNYTVTVSAVGYRSKNSASVNVSFAADKILEGSLEIAEWRFSDSYDYSYVGKEISAMYWGEEDVTFSYQWKKDGADVGTNSAKFTPTETGHYTVTISALGYKSLTSESIEIIEAPAFIDVFGVYYMDRTKPGNTISVEADETVEIYDTLFMLTNDLKDKDGLLLYEHFTFTITKWAEITTGYDTAKYSKVYELTGTTEQNGYGSLTGMTKFRLYMLKDSAEMSFVRDNNGVATSIVSRVYVKQDDDFGLGDNGIAFSAK